MPWELKALRESDLNGYCPKRKSPCLRFGKRQDLKGERGKPIYWCMPIELTLLFFLSFLSFLLCFLSYLFSFLLTLFFYLFTSSNILCFSIPSTGHGKGLFIAPAVANVLRSCPLIAFVWSGCTCRPHCTTPTLARQRRTCFIPLYVVAFLPATTLIPSLSTLRACTQRFPLKLPLLGGLSSQQDVPPKRGLGRSRE